VELPVFIDDNEFANVDDFLQHLDEGADLPDITEVQDELENT